MGDGRVLRFVLEAALLVGLAVVLGLADVRPLGIVVAMALGWVVVAIVEWVALREVPHYGSGFTPRYELPSAPLPPPRPIEQVAPYPTAREIEAPTWIAPAGALSETLGDWPVPVVTYQEPAPVAVAPVEPASDELERADDEDEAFAPAGAASDPWYVEGLPAEPLAGAPQARVAVHHVDPPDESRERRVFRRRRQPEGPVVEFPVLPRHAPLPRRGR